MVQHWFNALQTLDQRCLVSLHKGETIWDKKRQRITNEFTVISAGSAAYTAINSCKLAADIRTWCHRLCQHLSLLLPLLVLSTQQVWDQLLDRPVVLPTGQDLALHRLLDQTPLEAHLQGRLNHRGVHHDGVLRSLLPWTKVYDWETERADMSRWVLTSTCYFKCVDFYLISHSPGGSTNSLELVSPFVKSFWVEKKKCIFETIPSM